jgi:ATP-dependent Clp protease protease subunit
MQTIYIVGEIKAKTVVNFLLDYDRLNPTKPITIYLNSPGGGVSHGLVITDVINNNYKNITLIACGEIFSAAFDIFYNTKCKRLILPETIGMAHFCWSMFQLDESGKPVTEYDKFVMGVLKNNKSKSIAMYKNIGLTSKELSKIKTGKDCYFTTERLNELLENGKKNRS